MDPVSAFSLAAGIINVVDYGTRVLSTTYEIYKSGSGRSARDVELSTLSRDLSNLTTPIEDRLRESATSIGAVDSELLDLCRRSLDASAKLRKAIERLQASGTTKISVAASSFVSAIRSIWTDGEVKALRDQLIEIRSQMTVVTLVSIWEDMREDGDRHAYLRHRLDQISGSLDRHDKPARDFANELLNMTASGPSSQLSQANSDLLRMLWEMDWSSRSSGQRWLRWLRVPETVEESVDDADMPTTLRILGSLSFDGMHSREKTIPKAYEDTYSWILRDEQCEQSQKMQWPNFPAWLREDSESTYWITGKPGSGKSTLMKFIFHHPDVRRHLTEYAGDLPLVLTGYFFWNPGSTLQGNHEGLLRTLLRDCLLQQPDLIPLVTPRRWAFHHLLGNNSSAPEWTWSELRESFEILLSYNTKKLRLVMFLDGLDECEGEENVLIELIKESTSRYKVKLCVASRPWNIFSDAFSHGRSLRMQDLTEPDISQFVRGEFGKSPAFVDLSAVFPDEAAQIMKSILSRAEGVFLWVSLVVRSLLETLIDNASISRLQEILEETPGDIMGLYDSIWRSIPPERQYLASKYFQLCAAQPNNALPFSFATFWLASQGQVLHSNRAPIDRDKAQSVKNILKRQLDGHTRGILEFSGTGSNFSVTYGEPMTTYLYAESNIQTIQFLHRSAMDWAKQDATWTEISSKTPSAFDPDLDLLEAFLVQFPTERGKPWHRFQFFSFALVGFYYVERSLVSPNQTDVDRVVAALDKMNRLMCDWSCELDNISYGSDTSITSRHPDVEGFSLGHWSTCQLDKIDYENSFVGLAAQWGCLPYVRAKVAKRDDLLIPRKARVSLLENAIFPGLHSVRAAWSRNSPLEFPQPPIYDPVFPGISRGPALPLVRYLLETSTIIYETAFGESIYDAALDAKLGRLDADCPPERYDEVLKLLEKHGYGPKVLESSAKKGNVTADGSSDEEKSVKERGGTLRRLMKKLRF